MSRLRRLWHSLNRAPKAEAIRQREAERAQARLQADRVKARWDLIEMEVLSRRRQDPEDGEPC